MFIHAYAHGGGGKTTKKATIRGGKAGNTAGNTKEQEILNRWAKDMGFSKKDMANLRPEDKRGIIQAAKETENIKTETNKAIKALTKAKTQGQIDSAARKLTQLLNENGTSIFGLGSKTVSKAEDLIRKRTGKPYRFEPQLGGGEFID